MSDYVSCISWVNAFFRAEGKLWPLLSLMGILAAPVVFFTAVQTTTMLGSPANSRWCMWGPCNSCPSRDSHHSLTNDQQKPLRNHRNHEPLWKSFTWTSTSCLEPRNHTCQIPSLGHPSSSCGKTQRRSIPWRMDILATLPAWCSKQLD